MFLKCDLHGKYFLNYNSCTMEVEIVTKDQSLEGKCKNTLIILSTHYNNLMLDCFDSFTLLMGHSVPSVYQEDLCQTLFYLKFLMYLLYR